MPNGESSGMAGNRRHFNEIRATALLLGSRVRANAGNVRVVPAEELGRMGGEWTRALVNAPGIPGHEYYSDRYWEPENHWARQDRELEQALGGVPRVEVGEIQDYRPQPSTPDRVRPRTD